MSYIFIVIAILACFNAEAQVKPGSYIGYYQLINKAELLNADSKKQEALETCLFAFRNYTGFENDYTFALKISLNLKAHESTYWLLKQKTIKTGWFSEELFDTTDFHFFKSTKHGRKYLSGFDNWISENERLYNLRDLRTLVSIDASDQLVRNRTLSVSKKIIGNDSIYKKAVTAIMDEVDRENYIRFKKYCLTYGYPSRLNLGGKDLYLNVFFKHVFKFVSVNDSTVSKFEKDRFMFLDSMLRKQIEAGAYHPQSFAYCMDYSLSSDSISYYAIPRYFRNENGVKYINYPVIDPGNLNKRRASIGLMTIEEQCRITKESLPPNYLGQD